MDIVGFTNECKFAFKSCRCFPAAGCVAAPRTVEEAERLVLEREAEAQAIVDNIKVSDVVCYIFVTIFVNLYFHNASTLNE